jgi:hypothetical protein
MQSIYSQANKDSIQTDRSPLATNIVDREENHRLRFEQSIKKLLRIETNRKINIIIVSHLAIRFATTFLSLKAAWRFTLCKVNDKTLNLGAINHLSMKMHCLSM